MFPESKSWSGKANVAKGDVMGISDREGRPGNPAYGDHFYPLFLIKLSILLGNCSCPPGTLAEVGGGCG